MVSLVLTIIAFAGAMSVPAFLTAIVEGAASKIRPSSSRTRASCRMNWIDRCRPVAMLLPRNGTLRAWGTSRTPYGTRWKSRAAFSMRKSQTGQREKCLIFESRWGGVSAENSSRRRVISSCAALEGDVVPQPGECDDKAIAYGDQEIESAAVATWYSSGWKQ
jgi:hypothetical protein